MRRLGPAMVQGRVELKKCGPKSLIGLRWMHVGSNIMSYRQASQTYRQIGTQTSVEAASPHRLIQMLMEGGLQAIARAKGHLLHQDVAEKGTELSRAISIIEGLRVSLDKTHGGEIAWNLEALYLYMQERLLQANLYNRIEPLDEVAMLLRQIKLAWDAIGESAQGDASGAPAS